MHFESTIKLSFIPITMKLSLITHPLHPPKSNSLYFLPQSPYYQITQEFHWEPFLTSSPNFHPKTHSQLITKHLS
jgi:hypothetical protein